MKDRLGASCLKMQVPLVENEEFIGLIDVVRGLMVRFSGDEGTFQEEPLPANLESSTADLRNDLVEQLAEVDGEYSDYFLEVSCI